MTLDLVTGGSGLTGRALVDSLLAAGRRVRVLDLVAHPDLRVQSLVGDVCDPAAAAAACQGVDTVFHTVALVSQHPEHAPRMQRVNVGGTELLLETARAASVPRFVFTSSIDVVFSGAPIADGDESLPYAGRFLDDYGRTKAEAEQRVLAADGQGGMQTVSLRAAGVFGPHDRNRFPVILDHVGKGGFVALGDGRARFSHVYVDNLAHAHRLAAESLVPGAQTAGRAYFVTDHAPSNFFDFVEPYLAELGIRRAARSVPRPLAWGVACGVELGYHALGRWIRTPPVLTRYTVAATCGDFWFNHRAATADFGYQPVVSEADAFARTLVWLLEHAAERRDIPPAPAPQVHAA